MNDYGRASQATGPAAIKQLWKQAAQLDPSPAGGEWVPWRVIRVREDILPRDELSTDAIDRYALVFADLPPITVQRDTFVLVDGRHRLESAPRAASDFVRIAELDISDEELWERAFEENNNHGVPLRTLERTKAARRYMKAHPGASVREVARWAGINKDTVWRWQQQPKMSDDVDQKQPAVSGNRTAREDVQVSGNRTVPEEARVSGIRTPEPGANDENPEGIKRSLATATLPDRVKPESINLFAFRHLSPSELAKSVPDDQLDSQIDDALAAERWMKRYREALVGQKQERR